MSPLPLAGSTSSPASLFSEAGLIQNSRNIFQNLREQGFKEISERLKQSLGLSAKERPLPFRAGIEIGRPLPDGARFFNSEAGDSWTKYFNASKSLPRSANPLQTQIEKVVTDALVAVITGGRIDKQGGKGKINSLVESLVGTVVHAGVDALKQRFLQGFSPQSLPSPLIESAPGRAPPLNAPAIQEGSRLLSPQTGNQPLFQRTLDAYGRGNLFAYNGSGNPYQYQNSKSPYPQKLERLRDDTYRSENGPC